MRYTRRELGKMALAAIPLARLVETDLWAAINSKINGVQIGAITYSFRFKTPTGPFFLCNTQQTWQMWRNNRGFANGKTPINNIGPRSNGFVGVKDYEAAAEKEIVTKRGISIFAGQRDDPFFADVGAIFDLVAIRKAGTTGNMGGGKDFLSGYNVHTIALQIPISQVDNKSHTIGVWSSTDCRRRSSSSSSRREGVRTCTSRLRLPSRRPGPAAGLLNVHSPPVVEDTRPFSALYLSATVHWRQGRDGRAHRILTSARSRGRWSERPIRRAVRPEALRVLRGRG